MKILTILVAMLFSNHTHSQLYLEDVEKLSLDDVSSNMFFKKHIEVDDLLKFDKKGCDNCIIYTGESPSVPYFGRVNGKYSLIKSLKNNKIIYKSDDRIDYFVAQKEYRNLSDSTVLITQKNNLKENIDGGFSLATQKYMVKGFPLCEEERFREQPIGGNCTGFLVKPDLIVTAGHCLKNDDDLKNKAFIFGFKMVNKNNANVNFDASLVYYGKKIVARELSDYKDYAVIQLDRAVNAPLSNLLEVENDQDEIYKGLNVGVVGYPYGLPVKISYGASTVVLNNEGNNFFKANIDSYSGNSGSPVFSAGKARKVIGILVKGNEDWKFNNEKLCYQSNVVEFDFNGGETISRTTQFLEFIN